MGRQIGLVDVDGHNFPNLALMHISAWHKNQGDSVEWATMFRHYDVVYMSKVFSDVYSPDEFICMDADRIVKGGTGYAISNKDGIEIFDKSKDADLPYEVEHTFPDYSIYPQYQYAVAMTSRGCPRGCHFCHVARKEGRQSRKVANVCEFYSGQSYIQVLDPNITACKDKRDLFLQYRETGATIEFSQGLDIRLLNDADIDDINHMKIKKLHFAWDKFDEDLEPKFREFKEKYNRVISHSVQVYCLINFGSTLEQDLHRIYTLRDLGYAPYVMVYDRPHASKEKRQLQRWCNNRFIFYSCKKFEDYI